MRRKIQASSTSQQCSHNGLMEQNGACNCLAPWLGTSCNRLELGTVNKEVYGYREGYPHTTSWGGSAQVDEVSGKYIMLVSEYVE